MNRQRIQTLLEEVQTGSVSVSQAMEALQSLPFEDMQFARVDGHRAMRTGFPEVVFCRGKTPDQVVQILQRLATASPHVLATRATEEIYAAVREALPDAAFHPASGVIAVGTEPPIRTRGRLLVVSAGTSDIPVAEEAALTARWMGSAVDTIYDIGVAGIHRLFHYRQQIQDAAAIVVVAGMDGALPSVVAGLVEKPVIAVPTSIGYGASFQGLAPLLAMLNSCAAGLAVVNIDNGFGGGYMGALINLAAGRIE